MLRIVNTLIALTLVAPAATAQPASFEAQVDRLLQPYVDTSNFSGSVLVAREGRILVSKGYGLASVERQSVNGPQTVYQLASVSRVLTSAAILLLEQQGKLSVDDTLSKYLPDWPRGDEITIHHLLTLSAGFPNINSMGGYGKWSMVDQTPEDLVAKFRDHRLEFEPGSRTVHSNSNYNVLALLVEKVSKKSYGTFLAEELFAPLEMRGTQHVVDTGKSVPHRATGYRPEGFGGLRKARTLHWSVKTGNGSIASTTEDLYRFDRMLVNNTLLNESSTKKLFTEHFPANGYGWFMLDRFGTREIFVNGRSPGYGAYWGRAVDGDVTVILLGNLYSSATTPIGRNLMALTLGHAVETTPIRRDPPDPALLAQLVGTYQFGPEFYRPNGRATFRVEDGHLFYNSDWMIPAGGLHFVHRVYWSDLEFQRDASGKVVSLRFDDYVGVKQ